MSNTEEFELDDFTIEDGELIEYCGFDSDVVIPSIVTEIGFDAFNDSNIESLIIGDNVKSIGEAAFYECTFLETVTIGSGLKTIEFEAFAHCKNLKSITLGANVEKIEDYAFDNCPKLVITTTAGSYAEKYAKAKGIKVNLI